MIVEDNLPNMEIATELVTMVGMLTDTAENGKIAVGKMAAAPDGYYDLIFMDMHMPVMDGCEASRQIRNLDRPDARTVPIVAMTANAFAEDIEKTRQAGRHERTRRQTHRLQPAGIGTGSLAERIGTDRRNQAGSESAKRKRGPGEAAYGVFDGFPDTPWVSPSGPRSFILIRIAYRFQAFPDFFPIHLPLLCCLFPHTLPWK